MRLAKAYWVAAALAGAAYLGTGVDAMSGAAAPLPLPPAELDADAILARLTFLGSLGGLLIALGLVLRPGSKHAPTKRDRQRIDRMRERRVERRRVPAVRVSRAPAGDPPTIVPIRPRLWRPEDPARRAEEAERLRRAPPTLFVVPRDGSPEDEG